MSDPRFIHYLRVRYADCDAQQVVFNGKYAEYVDVAATEFVRHVFGGYDQMLDLGFDNQVVNLTINWRAPSRFDDVLAIRVSIGKIGRTSYTLEMEFYVHGQDRDSIADAQITYVMVDPVKFNKIEITDSMRLKLESAGRGLVSNHSGLTL